MKPYFLICWIICAVCLLLLGCGKKAVSDDRLQIDKEYLKFFYRIYKTGEATFVSKGGEKMKFITDSLDSVYHNTKGGFLNSVPSKSIQFLIRQLEGKASEKRVGREYVSKDTASNFFPLIGVIFNLTHVSFQRPYKTQWLQKGQNQTPSCR